MFKNDKSIMVPEINNNSNENHYRTQIKSRILIFARYLSSKPLIKPYPLEMYPLNKNNYNRRLTMHMKHYASSIILLLLKQII